MPWTTSSSPPDGGRRRPSSRAASRAARAPAVAHRERLDGAVRVADVRDAVRDDGRELDQRAEAARPDDAERRPQRGSPSAPASALRVDAVHRPLERRAVDADGRPRAACGSGAARARLVAGRRDRGTTPRGAGSHEHATPRASVRAERRPMRDPRAATRRRVSPSMTVTTGTVLARPCGRTAGARSVAAPVSQAPGREVPCRDASRRRRAARRRAASASGADHDSPGRRASIAPHSSSSGSRRPAARRAGHLREEARHHDALAEVAEPRLRPLAVRRARARAPGSASRPRSAAGSRRRSAG